MEHRAAHDHGLVAGRDETDGDELHPVSGYGLHQVLANDAWLACRAEHGGNVRSVDVGVDEADAVAELGERNGEVDGNGGLADAALAGADGYDVLDAGKSLRALRCWCVLVRHKDLFLVELIVRDAIRGARIARSSFLRSASPERISRRRPASS